MRAEQILAILQLLADAANRLQAVAQEDPEVWDQIKADFNEASKAFKESFE